MTRRLINWKGIVPENLGKYRVETFYNPVQSIEGLIKKCSAGVGGQARLLIKSEMKLELASILGRSKN
jgi:hypothetical protein